MHLQDPQYGYNLRDGGDGFTSEDATRYWQDPAFKDYASRQMRIAWQDPEKRKARSEKAKQRWADPDFHQKASEAVLNACRTRVKCVETQQVFDSIKDVEIQLGLNHANICRALRTGYKCGNYHWEYA